MLVCVLFMMRFLSAGLIDFRDDVGWHSLAVSVPGVSVFPLVPGVLGGASAEQDQCGEDRQVVDEEIGASGDGHWNLNAYINIAVNM